METPFTHPSLGPLHLGRPRVSLRNHKTMAKAFLLHDFMSALPDPPAAYDNTNGIVSWGMMGNNALGDCTCAACGHMIQAWTAPNGLEITVPDSAIFTEYEGACGYVPGNPSTDQGGDIGTVLDYFRTVGVDGHFISAHAEVNITQERIEQAISTFGGIDIGINLPISAQSQVGSLWTITGDGQTGNDTPGSWGGHSVAVIKYDATGLWCVTWGSLQKMTWQWFMIYCDESHACISPDWKSPVVPSTLISDLQQVGT